MFHQHTRALHIFISPFRFDLFSTFLISLRSLRLKLFFGLVITVVWIILLRLALLAFALTFVVQVGNGSS